MKKIMTLCAIVMVMTTAVVAIIVYWASSFLTISDVQVAYAANRSTYIEYRLEEEIPRLH